MTDDRKALGEHLEAATGERVAALEAVEPVTALAATVPEISREEVGKAPPEAAGPEVEKTPQPKDMEFDLGL